jgi:hypothetical protein
VEQPLRRCALISTWRRYGLAKGCGMPHIEDEQIVANEARAAVTGHNVRYVLVISTLAVIVRWFI